MSNINKVKDMLERYPENIKKIRDIQTERNRFVPISEADVLEMLMMPGKREDDLYVQRERSTDRLFFVATSYRKLARSWNEKVLSEMNQDIRQAVMEVEFVSYAIRALPKFYRNLLSFDVLEGRSFSEVCNKFHLSGTAFLRKKDRALCRMAETYERQGHLFGFLKGEINEG